jgi:RNA polymerase sigma factor (sigma-70 family)
VVDPERLFAENHEALRRYLLRYTGDPELAEDLAQETFLRLLQHRPDGVPARPWLFRVATNLACDAARSRRRRRLLLLAGAGRVPHGDAPEPPDRRVESAERTEQVQRALLELSEKERMALLMREEGFRHHEIVAAVGGETSSVGTLMARAVRKVARSLQLGKEDL